ncbi:MAG TPA: hypothetical protein VHK05_00245 [Candidatus Limnocylindrales bacterium]|nr:hypothetical protein [Candidatus Limnocylindrales bacterium]
MADSRGAGVGVTRSIDADADALGEAASAEVGLAAGGESTGRLVDGADSSAGPVV